MTVTVEHTHVFAALMTEYFDPTTSDDYDRILSRVSECMSWADTSLELPQQSSEAF